MKNPEGLTVNDLDVLTMPILPQLNSIRCSITRFSRERNYWLQRMKESGRPLALTSDGQPVALVHDLLSYYETEDRRKKLVSILDGTRKLMEAAANHPPTATLRTEGQEKEIAELARCSKRVEELKIQIEAWKERVKPFQDRLATIQRELDEAEIARAKSLELVTKKRESSEFSRPTQGT